MTAIGNPIEEFISLAEAARLIPGRPHLSTFYRWRTRGVNGIKLETVRIGGRRMISRSALVQFITAVTAAVDQHDPKMMLSAHRQNMIIHAEKELDRRGA